MISVNLITLFKAEEVQSLETEGKLSSAHSWLLMFPRLCPSFMTHAMIVASSLMLWSPAVQLHVIRGPLRQARYEVEGADRCIR
jgi:hypothetical protein